MKRWMVVWMAWAAGAGVQAADLSAAGALGYENGPALRVSAEADGFAKGFPFGVELGLDFALQDPGDAALARKVFINNATDGTPEQSAWDLNLRLDFNYNTHWLKEGQVYLTGGPRFSMFHGSFRYIGGNEEFEVITDQWGLGLGAKGRFRMVPRLDFVVSAGLDYYFGAALSGHDTTYRPDNDNVNPQDDYQYQDADEAVSQPVLVPSVFVGFAWGL